MPAFGTLIATVAAVAVLLAGCGGSSSSGTVRATAYVGDVCVVMHRFETSLRSREEKVQSQTASTISEGKEIFKAFLTGLERDVASARTSLQSAGVPNIDGGRTVAASFVGAFNQLDATIKNGIAQVAVLPDSNREQFKTAIATLGDNLQNAADKIGSRVTGSKTAITQLNAASEKAPSCKSVGLG